MFGFGGNRGGGLLGGLLGGGQPQYRQRRGGLLNSSLGRMALMAGAAYLGNRFLQSRGRGVNLGNMFGGRTGQSGGSNIGSGSDTWGNNSGSGGQSW